MNQVCKVLGILSIHSRIFPIILVNILSLAANGQKTTYFQQEVNYEIQVTLNDERHELYGFEKIVYINKSPDTLTFLFFHLWPNAYSNNKTGLAVQLLETSGREKLFKDPELIGYIDSLDFKIDGANVQYNLLPSKPDVSRIELNEPVFPGDTIVISTPFRIKIPGGTSSRLGHTNNSYQISQWYPKPAVYDRNGWHPMEYLDQGEFYSEFGRFNVMITLPAEYIVGATGTLMNKEESEWLAILSADTALHSGNNGFYSGRNLSHGKEKTLNFVQDNAHDFAWFADKRFQVRKSRLILPSSGKVIETSVMFTDIETGFWENALALIHEAIVFFSGIIGDYPYDTFTVVQAPFSSGLGMEYPGITVVDFSNDAYTLEQVIIHELCHNWFYGALGNNERRYPFMDEGITSAYEQRYMRAKYPEKKAWEIYFGNEKLARFFHVDEIHAYGIEELEWLVGARKNSDKPINLTSTDYTSNQYGQIIYYKAGAGFNYLRAFLGDSLFDSIMQDYYNKWKFRHPEPDDLRRAFESRTDKDLKWFFDDFTGTKKHVDYKISKLRNEQLLVKNKGDLASPLVISTSGINGQVSEEWSDGFTGRKWIDVPYGVNRNFRIDPHHQMPDLYRINNNYSESALFPKSDPLDLRFYFTIEDPEKISLMYIPLPNWTREDGFMAGIALHNGFILPERIEYFIIPFYSFGSKKFTGLGRISFNITPRNTFLRQIKISLEGSRFGAPGSHQYNSMKIGSTFSLSSGNSVKLIDHAIYSYYNRVSDLADILINENSNMLSYISIGYLMEKTGKMDPYMMDLSFETGKSFGKASVDFNYRYSYYGRNKGLDIRIFSGLMIINNTGRDYHLLSPAGRMGREQYLYQGIYPDRFAEPFSDFWSRQMTISEGSLVSPLNDTLGFSPWLLSLSFTSDLPRRIRRIPVKPFVNIILNNPPHVKGCSFLYEAGLRTGIPNVFDIYIPFIVPRCAANYSFIDRIRFTLNFNIQSISLF